MSVRRKKDWDEGARRKTVGLFDGLTEDEKRERERREELGQGNVPRGRPLSRRDAAERGKKMAANPPKAILDPDVKLEPCPNGMVAIVFVGASHGGVISKYACTYATPAQMDKLCQLWLEHSKAWKHVEPR